MKIRELRGLSPEDLLQKEKALKKELFELNFKRKYAQVEKPDRFRIIRRDIAKIKTLLNERKKDRDKDK